MSLPHALLTELLDGPCTGAELACRFERASGHYWHASHQQIYRELAWLEQAGWIQGADAGPGHKGKRAYAVQPAGRQELSRWLAEPIDPPPVRDAVMVRLRAAAVVGGQGLRPELRRDLAWHEQRLATYQALEAKLFPEPGRTPGHALQALMLRTGIRYMALRVDVVREALALLDAAD